MKLVVGSAEQDTKQDHFILDTPTYSMLGLVNLCGIYNFLPELQKNREIMNSELVNRSHEPQNTKIIID